MRVLHSCESSSLLLLDQFNTEAFVKRDIVRAMQASHEGAKHDEERRALTLSPLSGTESEIRTVHGTKQQQLRPQISDSQTQTSSI